MGLMGTFFLHIGIFESQPFSFLSRAISVAGESRRRIKA